MFGAIHRARSEKASLGTELADAKVQHQLAETDSGNAEGQGGKESQAKQSPAPKAASKQGPGASSKKAREHKNSKTADMSI